MKRFYIAGYKEFKPNDYDKGNVDQQVMAHLERNNISSYLISENLLLIYASLEGDDMAKNLAEYTNFRGIKDIYVIEIDLSKIYYWDPNGSKKNNIAKFIKEMKMS